MKALRTLAGSLVAIGGLLFLLQTQWAVDHLAFVGLGLLFVVSGLVVAIFEARSRHVKVNWLTVAMIAIIGFLGISFVTFLTLSG